MSALQTEVAKLQDRLAPTIAPTRSRDLFRFTARAARPPLRAARPGTLAAPATTPGASTSQFKLIGIAEDPTADGIVRTAIVSAPGDLFLVKAGETFGGRYRVDQVSSEAVQFTDTTTATSSTLALR